jgi:hypothetical protein
MSNLTHSTAKQKKLESYFTSGEVLVGIIWLGFYGMLILSVFSLNATQLAAAISGIW